MAKQQAKSGLMAKYGQKLDKAVKAHGSDETTYGVQNLPGGIKNGIAKLIDCRFGQYKSGPNKDEYFFLAAGIVVAPETTPVPGVGDMPIKGLRTQIMEPVCDTTNRAGEVTDQEAHIQKILNYMRMLGADTEGAGGAELESLAAALKEAGPYFKFSTSQGDPTPQFPNPRVWENWHGSKGLENYVPEDGDAGVNDETSSSGGGGEGGDETAAAGDADDLDALAEAADGGDEDAQRKLVGQGKLVNVDANDYPDWAGVAEAIKAADAKAEGGDEYATAPQGEDAEPVKGEIYFYKPPKAKKKVECEVTAVFPAAKKVNLKNLDDNAVYKGVLFTDISAE